MLAARTAVVARASELAAAVRASRRELSIAGVVVTWIAAGVWLDSYASIWPQRALGVVTWIVLLLILRGERRDVRAQVAIVIAVATAVEYTASGLLGVYTYRLHNIPWFVPPGHGLLYLTALALGRSQLFALLRRPVIFGTIVVGGAWAIWGLAFAPRNDAFGAIVYLCLLRFLLVGRAPLVYAGRVPHLQLPRADGDVGRHLGVGAPRRIRPARRRQSAERHPGRLLLLRRRRARRLRRSA